MKATRLAVLALALTGAMVGCRSGKLGETKGQPAAFAPLSPDYGFLTHDEPGVYPPGVFVIDDRVADAVRAALNREPTLARAARDIDVEVNKGTVTLTGTVASQTGHQQVLETVRKVPGVDRVVDRLTMAQSRS